MKSFIRMLISFAVVYGLVIHSSSFGALISTPSNVAVLKGREVAFSCSANVTADLLLWSILLPGTTSEVLIFDGFRANERICFCSVFTGKHANQGSTLYLPANESTAARYTCAEMTHGTRAIVQLIVLDSNPACSDNSTGDLVSLKCIVNFSGHWSPVVEWKQVIGQKEKEITDKVEITQTAHQFRRMVTIVSVLSVLRNKSASSYKCTIKFSSSNRPKETTADNIPPYNSIWTWKNKEEGGNETTIAQEKADSGQQNLDDVIRGGNETVAALEKADPSGQNQAGVTGGVSATVGALVLATAAIGCFYAWKKKTSSCRRNRKP